MCMEGIINVKASDEYWSVCFLLDQHLIPPHLLMIYLNWFDFILLDWSVYLLFL